MNLEKSIQCPWGKDKGLGSSTTGLWGIKVELHCEQHMGLIVSLEYSKPSPLSNLHYQVIQSRTSKVGFGLKKMKLG